jgi:Rad3-related DNA helicase
VREKFRESLVERAELRLSRARPVRRNRDEWELPGYDDLGDEYPRYIVRLAGNRYICTCYGHYGGDIRQRRICSHVLAVILWRKDHRDDYRGDGRRFPTPAELGLPAKFTSFRPVQVEALQKITVTKARWILLQAPTGSGKTLIAAAAQKLLKQRMLYTCHSKDLQGQFIKDFAYAVELKGRENYPTAQHAASWPDVHCGLCTKTKDDPRCKWCCPPGCIKDAPCLAYGEGKCETGWRTCPYEEQKKAALLADVAVLNFAMFLGEANYAGGFGNAKFPLVVCDEADLLESALMSFAELSISTRLVERLGIEPPKYKTKEDAWVEWAERVTLPRVSARLAELENPRSWSTASVREMREKRELERVKNKLELFARRVRTSKWVSCTENADEGDVILDAMADVSRSWVWKPVYVSDLAGHYLWRHGERFLLMSATILEPRTFARNLGIPDGEWEFVDIPSTFPKEHRPVYYIPAANMTHKTAQNEWPKVVEAVDAILDQHPDEKVLVHTVSYALSRSVAANTRHRDRLVIYNGARDRAAALERFRASSEPLVMLAPSMERGVDLSDDACRVVIILKVPYRSLGDKQVSARLYGSKDGRAWYVVDAIRTLVQMSGRGVRHEKDWAKTYILDSQFGLIMKEWKRTFPAWWLEAVQFRPK